uniref:Uncharacterized protein n=2 Tax=Trichogramma kaykai TaxID=54128 RepID=A0ABD2WWE3_9HYME
MQMEADTVRKKYQAVKASFKSDACLYSCCLDELEKSIREQDNEIERLQKVKMEAIELRETTKETLTKQELEAFQKSKERESIIQEYRTRVEDRKIELERLERLIFPAAQRQIVRGDDLDTGRKSRTLGSARGTGTAPPQSEIDRLEEIFVKLRNATGVSQTSQVLDRFLAQRATREKLKRMQTSTEAEKVQLEKHRQQLTAEIEMLKFAETKDADQNADKLENLNKKIENQKKREKNAMDKQNEYQYLLEGVRTKLILLCDKLQHENEIEKRNELPKTPMEALDLLNNKINKFIEKLGGPEKYNELVIQLLNDNKAEAMSLETTSEPTKHTSNEEQPLFTLFSSVSTPAAHQVQISEDEEDVPSRGLLKRQAQLLVDAKSRRKNFAFKR